jgi:hypothetical protein
MAKYSNGATFEGHWANNLREGRGKSILESKQGTYQYFGFYHTDKKHGFGIEVMQDGTVYEGDFYMEKRHGRGKITWPSKACYEGDWNLNKIEGTGTLTFGASDKKKDKYEGSFKDN